MGAKSKTIDDYLDALRAEQREPLEKLRRMIKSILPHAEECISYSMPAFRVDGQVIAGFQETKSGCSFYPFSGSTLSTLAAELGAYSQTKSALHFDPARPLPKALVRKLLAARLAETERKSAKKARSESAKSAKKKKATTLRRTR